MSNSLDNIDEGMNSGMTFAKAKLPGINLIKLSEEINETSIHDLLKDFLNVGEKGNGAIIPDFQRRSLVFEHRDNL